MVEYGKDNVWINCLLLLKIFIFVFKFVVFGNVRRVLNIKKINYCDIL